MPHGAQSLEIGKMKQYRVRYVERGDGVPDLDGWFVCFAEDPAHAIEQAKNYAHTEIEEPEEV